MTAATRPRYSLEEYVRLEAHSNVKHEFLGGEIWATGGGTPRHAALASAIIAAFSAALRGRPSRVYTSDARVRVQATGLDTYPDVTVVCGGEQVDEDDRLALVNPLVLVEVTSASSEAYDRGEKLEHYKQIRPLREVVIVSHTEPMIEVFQRVDGGATWTSHVARSGLLGVPSIACELDVADIYRDPFAPSP
ncbi:MAG: Uma2 family endonuclease [Labilithrix sp.]|nr:Uma2 family endonuclease [Labilithrix sp.]